VFLKHKVRLAAARTAWMSHAANGEDELVFLNHKALAPAGA